MSAPKFSLSFTKKIEKKTLQPSAIRNDAPRETETKTENIESIEENVLKTDGKAQEEELVIPMIQIDRAEIFRKLAEKNEKQEADTFSEEKEKEKNQEETKDTQAKPLTLDEQAEAALLEESKKKLDTWSERGAPNSLTIQVNQKDSTDDSELYAVGKESSIDNYDEVNVEHFGAALLRGMGWQKKEGIGKRNKQVVDIIDPSAKTFGLIGRLPGEKGVGETKSAAGEEELTLQKGSFVFIHSGRQRGTYGVVESMDEDHILVKAAVSQAILREVELNVRVVSQKEFKDSSRVINKEMYDKYKEKEKKEKEQKKKSKYTDDSDDNDNRDKRKSKKEELKKTLKEEEQKKTLKEEELKKTVKEEDKSYSADDKLRRNAESTDNRNKYKEESDKGGRGSDNRDEKYRNEDNEKSRYKENYEKGSKYQKNSEKDNRYKESENRGSRQREDGEGKSRYTETRRKDDYSSKSSKRYQGDSSKYTTVPADYGSGQKRSKNDDYKQDMKKLKSSSDKMPAVPWVRENLRVRLINKDYKGGRYHKEKVIVRNVVTAECCECMTTEGDILRKVHPEWLETVIPKIPPQIIMIVKGKQKGQRGQILQLHKDQEKASVQLLEDETVIMKLHYDDICEYVYK